VTTKYKLLKVKTISSV